MDQLGDPVHIGTGAFISDPIVDVRFRGSPVPLELVRHFSSVEAWQDDTALVSNRLAPGWITTFDEELFDDSTASGPGVPQADPNSSLTVIQRLPTGRGRSYSCAAPHDGTMDFTCSAASDGSMAFLSWAASTQSWSVRDADGVVTSFGADGRILTKHDTWGRGWDVYYATSGTFAGYLDYAQDELGRTLTFHWTAAAVQGDRPQLTSLTLASGTTVATFTYDPDTGMLSGATSAAGSDAYVYDQQTNGSTVTTYPRITQIIRDGQAAVTVSYEPDANEPDRARVSTVTAHDGSYSLRYAGDPGNVCPYPTTSTLIVDRSTAPLGNMSCSTDADCAGGSEDAVCDAGVCRAYTCQSYLQDGSPSGVNWHLPVSISGKCQCSNATTLSWSGPMPGGPKATEVVARNGMITTHHYDADGRLDATCVGDDDDTVTTDPASCPGTGYWTELQYDSNWPMRIALRRERSRLDPAGFHDIQYTYDTAHPDLITKLETGWTEDLTGTVTPQTLEWDYTYDTQGHLRSVVEPDGAETTYTYHPSGSGNDTGLLDAIQKHVPNGNLLETRFSSYTELGLPQTITKPSSASETWAYDTYGRPSIHADDYGYTVYSYYDSGRLKDVSYPSGRRTERIYDAPGRLTALRTYDSSSNTSIYDEEALQYDDAGRVTQVSQQRHNSDGSYQVALTASATYDDEGYVHTESLGGLPPETFVRDSAGMGFLEELDLPDGATQSFGRDQFGRQTSWTRHISGMDSTYASDYAPPTGLESGSSHPTTVTDPGQRTRSYTYDDFGELIDSSSADAGETRWAHSGGHTSQALHPDGSRTDYTYDTAGRLVYEDNKANDSDPSAVGQDYAYLYDDGDGAITCPFTYSSGPAPCAYRKGELAEAQYGFGNGGFFNHYYDYTVVGKLRAEQEIDGSQIGYDYDTYGRFVRTDFATFGYAVRREYDANAGDGEDPSEVTRIVGEKNGQDQIVWARSMHHDAQGKLAWNYLADNPTGAGSSVFSVRYTTGQPAFWTVARQSGQYLPMNRFYGYYDDGMVSQYTGTNPQYFLYDDANRLTCATATSVTSCPPAGDASLIASYSYDASDNRTSSGGPDGTTTYTYAGNQLTEVDPPGGRQVLYAYDTAGRRYYDHETTQGVGQNDRYEYYDGLGRLQAVTITDGVPGAPDVPETHNLYIYYDQLSHPIYVLHQNTTTGELTGDVYYWGPGDRLIGMRHVSGSTNAYSLDVYADIGPQVTGTMHVEYDDTGAVQSETPTYTARDPVGQPVAVWNATSGDLLWSGEHAPFGQLISSSGDPSYLGPWGFEGQTVLADSQVETWDAGVLTERRPALYLTKWRAYDPMLGTFISPDPAARAASLLQDPLYDYADSAPMNFIDPDGRQPPPSKPCRKSQPDPGWCRACELCVGLISLAVRHCEEIPDPEAENACIALAYAGCTVPCAGCGIDRWQRGDWFGNGDDCSCHE